MELDGWLIVYQLDPGSHTRSNQVVQKLYGQVTYTNGRRYRRRGLLEDLGHVRVGRGIVLVRAEDGPPVVRRLRYWAKGVDRWPVPLRAMDRRRIAATSKGSRN